ncbi:unnamed protein product [Pieris macdunnoughi]|uniref:Cytochrome P450 n=1 Tax=Pieris macdunnoughi TaxID=345717 RepID=A0A821VS78_9NEOP|nr:unnamed protein product [Pieris macdunnoughi]
MLWLLIIFALCCVYIYLSIKMYPGDMPVYPGRVPILGNISLLLGDSIDSWHYIKKLTEYTYNNGHVSVVYAGIMPIYLITDPDDCYKVLTTCLERPGFANKFLKQFLGNGLLTGPEAIWKQHRKLINPAFNQQVVDSFMGIFNTQSRRLVETLKNHVGKGQFDHHDYLEKTALETISLTMAGVDISNQKEFNYKCLMAFRAVVDGVIARAKNPLYYFDNIYRTSELKKIEDAHVKITHELTEQVLKKKREVYATEDKDKESSEKKFKPFLHRLLDFSNTLLSDNDIKDEMNNIMYAGSQSSSAVLAYTLLILGTYPRILEKCQQEIREIFGESDRDVEKADLTNLKYIDAVLKETIRQCPVAPFTGRLITEDIQLKNTVLRKGYPCAILLYGILNNPALWGKDASEFIPERWLEGRLPENSNALGAFGFGRRNCVGKVYAFTTMKVALVHILRRYKMTGNFFNMKLKNQVINKPAGGHEISIEFA